MDALRRYAILFVPVLASCGGSASNVQSPLPGQVFEPNGSVVNACSSEYYQELTGEYDGQISFADDAGLSCMWEVDFQITSGYTTDPVSRSVCDLTFNMASTGATEGCADVGIGGKFIDLLASPSNVGLWTNTTWPVDGFAQMASEIPDSAVYPIGISAVQTNQFRMTFDGLGNIGFPDSQSAEPEYSGMLIKR